MVFTAVQKQKNLSLHLSLTVLDSETDHIESDVGCQVRTGSPLKSRRHFAVPFLAAKISAHHRLQILIPFLFVFPVFFSHTNQSCTHSDLLYLLSNHSVVTENRIRPSNTFCLQNNQLHSIQSPISFQLYMLSGEPIY